MTTPEPLTAAPPSADVDAALLAIERAEKAVDDLCQGRLRWEMRVPAEPDHDPDLIISDALRLARAAIRAEAGTLDVERLVEDGRKWQEAEAEGHIVTFTETGYGLTHPPSCRPDLIGCWFNRYLADMSQPDEDPGRYRMTRVRNHAEYARLAGGER